ncbi:MAG: hypothetical protein RR444_06165 [Oscillospiraceae bacterium]
MKFMRSDIVLKHNLKTVSNYVFTMPDKHLNDVRTVMEQSLEEAQKANLPDITTGIEKNISNCFTADAFESFKRRWYTFNGFATCTEYKSQVKDVKISDYSDNQEICFLKLKDFWRIQLMAGGNTPSKDRLFSLSFTLPFFLAIFSLIL